MAKPIEITIGAAFAGSFAKTVTGAQNSLQRLGSIMSRIGNAQAGIGQMQSLSASANQPGRSYGATKQRAEQLRAALAGIESPTKAQIRELELADAATEKARLALERQREALRSLKGELQAAGVNALPRGKVMYGMARKFMRSEARNTTCSWSIQDGQMVMVEDKGVLPGEAIVLTHETGLVGTPEQTNEGVKVRCLINPQLKINGQIKLDNKSIQEAKTDLKSSSQRPPKLDNDGLYRILKVEFQGDTRGTDWYADMICVGMDGTSSTPLDKV